MSNYKIDAEVVLRAAEGRWEEILSHLAPVLQPALKAAPKHVSCPIHGGEDGFRFFKDYRTSGSCICNSCGSFDGLHILMAVNRWSFFAALKAINDYLRVPQGVEPEGHVETYEGKVLSLGMGNLRNGASCFCMRLRLKSDSENTNGTPSSKVENKHEETATLWGADLQRAVSEAEIAVGDNVRVNRLGTKTFVRQGEMRRKTLWSAQRLASDAEVAAKAAEGVLNAKKRAEVIASRWASAKAIRSDDVEAQPILKYFECRGIRLSRGSRLLRNVRYSPDEPFFDGNKRLVGRFPCMICAVRKTDGQIVTLHKTWLTPDGKKLSGYGPCKKLMSLPQGETINGSCISFGEVSKEEGILCVAEGVETALSVSVATGYPTVSSISANGMTTFEVPEGVKTVFIFADRDRSETGQKAALRLRGRLLAKGIPSVICLPPEDGLDREAKGVDWNDVLRRKGISGFPFRKDVVLNDSGNTPEVLK